VCRLSPLGECAKHDSYWCAGPKLAKRSKICGRIICMSCAANRPDYRRPCSLVPISPNFLTWPYAAFLTGAANTRSIP